MFDRPTLNEARELIESHGLRFEPEFDDLVGLFEDAGWGAEHAGFYLMAVLMQQLEDTTAIHRCGIEGLARLRRDGARLQRLLEQHQAPEPMLNILNQEYRSSGLTMGGVADCMALTFALQETAGNGVAGLPADSLGPAARRR